MFNEKPKIITVFNDITHIISTGYNNVLRKFKSWFFDEDNTTFDEEYYTFDETTLPVDDIYKDKDKVFTTFTSKNSPDTHFTDL